MTNIKARGKKFIFSLCWISFGISVLLLVYGMLSRITASIDNKVKYELVTIGEEEYVVLSEHDEKVLAVPYEVKEDGQYIFYTGNYQLYEIDEGIYRYISMECSPEICKDD